MRVEVKGKNYNVSDNLREIAEKKFAKLDKYFPGEINATLFAIKEKDHYKTEATIKANNHYFRAEVITQDPYDAVDRLVDKLTNQMSKFKTKLQKKYKDHKGFAFSELPVHEEEVQEIRIAKKKSLELTAMSYEAAVVAMEQLSHDFYVFLNEETDKVCVAYKRNDGGYGILETVN